MDDLAKHRIEKAKLKANYQSGIAAVLDPVIAERSLWPIHEACAKSTLRSVDYSEPSGDYCDHMLEG